MKRKNAPSNRIPCDVRQVEDEILLTVILRSAENLVPVLQVRPRFFGCAAAEWREASQELEEDAPQGPVVDGIGVSVPAKHFRCLKGRYEEDGISKERWGSGME